MATSPPDYSANPTSPWWSRHLFKVSSQEYPLKSDEIPLKCQRRQAGYKKIGIAILIFFTIISLIFVGLWSSRTRFTPKIHEDDHEDLPDVALWERGEMDTEASTLPVYPLMLISGPRYQRIEGRSELPPVLCGEGRKGCGEAGQPNICCPEDNSCQRTNNTLTGVMCCPDGPCSDSNPICPNDTYACDASKNGGCCPLGTMCTLDRCIPRDDMARYLSILEAASIGITISKKMNVRKGLVGDNIRITETVTETPAPSRILVRIPEERLREVEVTRQITKTTTELQYTASPTPQPSAVLVAAPSPTTLPDIDGDGLSGTQDPTETRPSTILPTPTEGETDPTTESPAPTSTSGGGDSSTGQKKYPVPTTVLVSSARKEIIKIGGDSTFTRFIPAVYARIETTSDNKVIERYISPEQVARANETRSLKASLRASGVTSKIADRRLCLFSVGLSVAIIFVFMF